MIWLGIYCCHLIPLSAENIHNTLMYTVQYCMHEFPFLHLDMQYAGEFYYRSTTAADRSLSSLLDHLLPASHINLIKQGVKLLFIRCAVSCLQKHAHVTVVEALKCNS